MLQMIKKFADRGLSQGSHLRMTSSCAGSLALSGGQENVIRGIHVLELQCLSSSQVQVAL